VRSSYPATAENLSSIGDRPMFIPSAKSFQYGHLSDNLNELSRS
jgi:hypothetical protein